MRQIITRRKNVNMLQHTALHCNILQHTAAHCNTLHHTVETNKSTKKEYEHITRHKNQYNSLQHTAAHGLNSEHTKQICARLYICLYLYAGHDSLSWWCAHVSLSSLFLDDSWVRDISKTYRAKQLFLSGVLDMIVIFVSQTHEQNELMRLYVFEHEHIQMSCQVVLMSSSVRDM